MVNCAKCGKKIGFFQAKHDYTDENGNSIKYCSDCNSKYEEQENKKRLHDYTDENGNSIKYCSNCNSEYEKKENEKRLSAIKPILKKYFDKFDKCDVVHLVSIGRLYSANDIFEKFENESLENVKQHFITTYSYVQEAIDRGNYDDLDGYMNLKKICEITFDFLNDLEKILKLFNKKEIDTNYPELIELFHELVDEPIHQKDEQISKAEHKRISNKLKKNISVRNVIKEFMKSPLNPEVDVEITELLLKKFNLDFNEDELPQLIQELNEEVDLENFEENLGETNKEFHLPDYDGLNGHQFESFLTKVFEALDYVTVNTKLSGDQGADLIIMKDGEKTVVQAKKYSGKVSNKAIQEVVSAKAHYKCKNAMVVTTGEFTKSAVQLAISNNVELWDKTKLEKVIAQINNSSKKSIKSSQSVTLNENSFPVSCPYCSSGFNLSLDDVPSIGEQTEIECPECGMSLSIKIPEQCYTCVGCKKEFETLKEKIKHSKKCEKAKERQFNCKHCKKEFTLDDDELKEFKNKGTLKVECPDCKKSHILKR